MCNVALEAPFQIFLTATVFSLYIIDITPSPYIGVYAQINLSWWPVFSTLVSLALILHSFLKTSAIVSNGHGKWFGIIILIPIFAFRMMAWTVCLIIFAEFSGSVFLSMIIAQAIGILVATKIPLCIEWIVLSIQSLVFPFPKLLSKNTNSLEVFLLLVVPGNVILMLLMTFILTLSCIDIFDTWGKYDQIILLTEDWFEIIFWTFFPIFVASILPLILLHYCLR